ncbi:hypothetical protein Taro_035086 [Colocasia esculenta]|uniref:FLZ-type domain-containing protein n=1 Tax=Colocasia esculenta TaxID=4460 RepID=A0A843VZH7_COLES|nr:hypothetical protein [Colocasia esculenta]
MAEYDRSLGPLAPGAVGLASRGEDDPEASIYAVAGARCLPGSPPSRRWGSCVALGVLTPRSAGSGGARFFFDPVLEDEPRHFLDACFLCKKPLGRNRDIYMYRGDTPFCSEECRQEQIEMDEAKEKGWSLSMKASASRKEQQKQKDKAAQDMQVHAAGAVVAV